MNPWWRRVAGFAAGVMTAWLLGIAASHLGGWVLLVAGVVLWATLVLAVRGSAAPLVGLVAGVVVAIAISTILWSAHSECAYEDAAGRVVVTDCGAPRP